MKDCPENKILNPATNRCVLKTSAIGKKLLKGEEPKQKEPKQKEPKAKPKKDCPPDKILNEKTGRCVKNTSANRKKISSVLPAPPSIPSVPIIPSPIPAPIPIFPIPVPSLVPNDKFYDVKEYLTSGEKQLSKYKKNVLSKEQKINNLINYGKTVQEELKKKIYEVKPPIFYDTKEYFNHIVPKDIFYDVNQYGEDEIDYSQKYHLAPQYTKKEYEEFKKRNKKIRANLENIKKIQNTPEYMKSLFDKPTTIPTSQVDILEGIALANKYVRESNKPKIKRKPRGMI